MPARPTAQTDSKGERNMRLLVLAIAMALVMLQTLGALHRVLHGVHGPHATVSVSEVKSPLAALWGDHSKTSDCQSFDHAMPDGFASATLTSLTQALPALWLAMAFQERFALTERFFSSRGPPVALT